MKLSTPSCLWLAAVAALASGPLAAQPKAAAADYPNRVVRIILPQPAGAAPTS